MLRAASKYFMRMENTDPKRILSGSGSVVVFAIIRR